MICREPADQLVAEFVVGVALAAQAGAVEGDRMHVLDRAGVEADPVRLEQPRPAEHLAASSVSITSGSRAGVAISSATRPLRIA